MSYSLKHKPGASENVASSALHIHIDLAAVDDDVDETILTSLGLALASSIPVTDAREDFVAELVLAIRAHVAHRSTGTPSRSRPRGSLSERQMQTAMRLLENGDAISIATVAAACNVSIGHFSRAFRLRMGVQPRQWRMEKRIERAKLLMLESNKSLTEISGECGFSEQSHFNHAFDRVFGQSPGAWRKQHAPERRTPSRRRA